MSGGSDEGPAPGGSAMCQLRSSTRVMPQSICGIERRSSAPVHASAPSRVPTRGAAPAVKRFAVDAPACPSPSAQALIGAWVRAHWMRVLTNTATCPTAASCAFEIT